MQKWFHGNDILIYLTHNDSKSEVAERLIKTFEK